MNLESSDHQNLVSYSNMAVNHKFNRYLVIKGLDKNRWSPQYGRLKEQNLPWVTYQKP